MQKILLVHIFLLIPNYLLCIKSFNLTDKDELWDPSVNRKNDDEFITTTITTLTDSSAVDMMNATHDYDDGLSNVFENEMINGNSTEATDNEVGGVDFLAPIEDVDFMADDKATAASPKKPIHKIRVTPTNMRPKPGQRSLVIVFDGTGSMLDDLKQLRSGAEQIIEEVIKKKDNPIYNYIFVPFRDPAVGPMLVTTQQEELMEELRNMKLWGGGDCPESALAGIKMALEKALPGSFIYVFTDAIAKDFKMDNEVLHLVQQKQTPIFFLSTGFCNAKNSSGYEVFEKLASASNGQVYDLNKTDIAEVLESVRLMLDINQVPLKSVDFEEGGVPHQIGLEVDKSLKEFSVSVAGTKPNIDFTDPNNENYTLGTNILNLNNIRMVNVQDPIPGKWSIVAGSESGGSVRFTGKSDVAFKFGFAIEQPNDIIETSHRPLSGSNNILSISASDMSVIKNLTHVTIDSFASKNDVGASKFKFQLPLKHVNETSLFITDPFPPPRQMFKIFVHGFDADGNPLERLLSTVIQPIENSPPEVTMEQPKMEVLEFNEMHFKCLVTSLTPVTIQFKKSQEVLKELESRQSNVLEYTIKSASLRNSGRYMCHAVNSAGATEALVHATVKPRSAPVVNVYPQVVNIVEFESPIEIHCSVENTDENTTIFWNFENRPFHQHFIQPNYTIHVPRSSRNFTGQYTCIATSYNRTIEDSAMVTVEYPAILLGPAFQNASAPLNDPLELSCSSEGSPTPTTNWYFTHFKTRAQMRLMNANSYHSIDNLGPDTEGEYMCQVENGIGDRLTKTMFVSATAVAPPVLQKTNNTYVVANAGDDVTLTCKCELCKPLYDYGWSSETSKNLSETENMFVDEQFFNNNEFEMTLHITNVSEAQQGLYKCIAVNEFGQDILVVELSILVPPKIEKLIVTNANANDSDDGAIALTVGTSTHIKCVTKGLPMPIVTWTKDGVPILDAVSSNSSSLTISDAKFHDAGVYSCQAINALGKITKELTLLVLGPPSLKSAKENSFKSVVAGTKIELPCDIVAIPPPQVTWLLNGRNLKLNEEKLVNANNSLLFNADKEDSGIYECRATNEFGEASQKLVLVIYTLPIIYPVADEVVKVTSNSDVVIRCDATGNPIPEISWSMYGTKLTNSSDVLVHKTGELTMANVTDRNAGTYVCDAFNGIGTAQKIFYLVVYEPPKIITEFTGKVQLIPGQAYDLECRAIGNPVPNVYWTKDDIPLSDSNILKLTPSSNSSQTKGNYTCVAENAEGIDTRCIEIQMISPPKMKRDINESLKKVSENDPVDFVCPYEGYEKITWYKDDVAITSKKNSKLIVRNGVLSVRAANVEDHGQYSCLVENEAGQANYTFTLQVKYPPSITEDDSNNINPDTNVEITLLAGEDVKIECKASGNPPPEISWIKDDAVVSQMQELLLPSVLAEDEGVYTCVAENSEGQAQKSYHVNVMEKPTYHYGDLEQFIELNVGDDLTLDCTMAGNPHPVIEWFIDDQYLEEYQEILEYKNVQIRNAGHYKCSGRNSVGYLEIIFHVKIHEPPKVFHFTEILNVNEGHTGKLLCVVKGHPNPIISILHDGVPALSTARVMQTSESMDELIGHGEIIIDEYGNGVSIQTLQSSETLIRMRKYGKLTRNGDQDEMRFEYVIPKVKRTHNGTFSCVATNALGSGSAEGVVVVHVPPYLVENKNRPQNLDIVEGLPIILMCPIRGLPQPKITWFQNGQHITNGEDSNARILDHETIFSISQALVNDSGMYECIGENQAGRKSLQYRVNVLVLPRFVSTPSSDEYEDLEEFDPIIVYTEQGRTVQLNCDYAGNPEPTVYWVKINFEDPSQNQVLDTRGSILNLPSVQETTSFSCYGNNTVGYKEKLFHVIVQTPPQFEKPFAEQRTVNLYLGINLECKVTGTPEPSVTWFKDGTDIFSNGNKRHYSTSEDDQILRILNSKKSDSGTYVCEAENLVGRARKSFSLDVKVPVSWSPWQSWSACSATCGKGTKTRARFCIQPNGIPAKNEDYDCVGENIEVQICEIVPCPVNGGWSRWNAWSACSATCLEGGARAARIRRRKCDSPTPGLGGKYCSGSDVQEEICNDVPFCPIDGGWTEWSKWSTCSSTCGFNGVTTRQRYCQNPLPQFGGAQCVGNAQESKICSPNKPCPINGGWSQWSDWSACSKTCGTGVRLRRKKCDNPEPKYEGGNCEGDSVELEKCTEKHCKNSDITKQIKSDRNKYAPYMEFETYDDDESRRVYGPNNNNNNYEYFHAPTVEYAVSPTTQTISRHQDAQPRAFIKVENSIPITKDMVEINFNVGGPSTSRRSSKPLNFQSKPTGLLCASGFHFDDVLKRCEDTDECQLENTCQSGQKCVNTPGSYHCTDTCQPGFKNVEGKCLDINECTQNLHDCSHYCENLIGSYKCKCPSHYYLDKSGKKCVTGDQQNDNANVRRHYEQTTAAKTSLVCPDGYDPVNGTCQDINECLNDQHVCDTPEQTCLNNRGGYLCVPTACPADYQSQSAASSNQCIQLCHNNHCSTDATVAQSFNYHVVSINAFDYRLPIIKLVNYDLLNLPIERTTFGIIETSQQTSAFRLEKIVNKQGIVYMYANEGQLEKEKLYKIKVLGQSYDKNSALSHSTTSVVYIFVQK